MVDGEGLTVTRDGGDTYEFHEAVVECLMSEAGDGDVEIVRITAPADYRDLIRGDELLEPFLYVEVIPGTLGRHEFPLEEKEFDKGPSDVVVFGADPEGNNELAGDVETATGEITIIEATCDPEPRVAFTIKATLGSEMFDGRSSHVSGSLEAGKSAD